MKNKVLVIAAHPDDEVLGCGGTIAKHINDGDKVFVVILGEGITSRDEKRDAEKRKREIKTIKKHIHKAGEILNVTDIYIYDYPDNRFDTVSLLDIIKTIEKIKNKIKPDIIYTHHYGDLNIDHRITFDAVMTATRPVQGESVKEIYSFEVPSSTEWYVPSAESYFMPNVFIDISETIEKKLQALKVYKSEARQFPHPRSPEAVKSIAKRWGSNSGLKYAEAFCLVRLIKV